MSDVTELLAKAAGDRQAMEDLYLLTEPELRKLALHWIRRNSAKGRVSTTEVIERAFGKLMRIDPAKWQHRGAFYKFASQNVLCVLIDLLRQIRPHESLPPEDPPVPIRGLSQHTLLTLRQALEDLGETLSEDHRAVVELRFMGGCTLDEVAEHLSITRDKAFRLSNVALAYLRGRLRTGFSNFGQSSNHASGD